MSLSILDVISPGLREEMDLKPLEDGQVVEFRLLRAGVVDPFSTKKTATPQAHIIPGQDLIRDTHDKANKEKMILNITGYNPIKGKPGEPTYMDPIFDYVRFGSTGSIFITPGEENQLYFMKLMNKNQSNTNRKVNKAAVFKEINEKKEISIKNNIFDYRVLASNILYNAEADVDIYEIATKVQKAQPSLFKFTPQTESDKVKASLASIAEKYPLEFILAVKEAKSYARVIVDDAVSRKLIFFDDHSERMSWNWKRTPGQKGKKKITEMESPKNSVRSLVDFLLSKDGSEDYVELRQLHEEYYHKPR